MDAGAIPSLLDLATNVDALGGARQIAGYCVNHDPSNMHNCCAATLSALLDFAGIYVGMREAVLDLAPHLETARGWTPIAVGGALAPGDVGVVLVPSADNIHHIYLVVDPATPANPTVADNQGTGIHPRPVAGGNMPGVGAASPTTYFLRAT